MDNMNQGMNIGPGLDLNPMEYPEVTCPHCGCNIFQPGVMFRNLPGTLFGQAGEKVQFPLKVFYCINCRKLSPADQEIIDDLTLKANNKENCLSTKLTL